MHLFVIYIYIYNFKKIKSLIKIFYCLSYAYKIKLTYRNFYIFVIILFME